MAGYTQSFVGRKTSRGLGLGLLCAVGSLAAAAQEAAPIPIRFTLEESGVVTLVIDDAGGRRVRNLIAETPFEAGEHVIDWDGKGDKIGTNIRGNVYHGVPIFRHDGEYVEPGKYVVKGIVRDSVELRYEMPLNTAGNPPWPTADGRGAWVGDTLSVTDVVVLPGDEPQMLLGAGVTESYGIVWTDLDGRRLAGIRSVGGGGGWWGAYLLAHDNGPEADPAAQAYLGGSWKKTLQVFALTAKPPIPDPANGIDAMTISPTPQHGRQIVRFDADKDYPDLHSAPSNSLLGGLAAHNRVLVFALTALDKLEVRSAADGKLTQTLELASPRGLVVTADGGLLALSGNSLVRYDAYPPTGEPRELVGTGLEDPRQLALDTEGNIYVSDRALHQVKVFSAAGTLLRTIGEPGGPQVGPYNPRRMVKPEGLAVAPDGKLWVAENHVTPRRISIWNLDGTFVKALTGNGWYGGGGFLDPLDPTRAYDRAGMLAFKLDWEKGTSEVSAVYGWKPGAVRITGAPGHASSTAPHFPIHAGGRRYLSNAYADAPMGGEGVLVIWKEEGGYVAPVAAFGIAGGQKEFREEPYPERMKKAGGGGMYTWSDLNGDGQIQPEEVQFAPAGRHDKFTLQQDMAIIHSSGGVAYRPRFTAEGVPVYDLQAGETLLPGAGYRSPQILEAGDGWVISSRPMKELDGHVAGGRDGERIWHYPVVSIGNHAGYATPPPTGPGQMIGTTRLAGPLLRPHGTDVELWSQYGNHGQIYVMTTDGLFVATLFKDAAQAKPGPPEGPRGTLLNDVTAGYDAFFCTLSQVGEQIYAIVGHASYIVRVDGLESIRRLPPQEIHVSGEALAAVQSLGAITPVTHPDIPVTETEDGRRQFHYSADIQRDEGAPDAISAGRFARHPPHMAHINGIVGEPTVYKFETPGDIEAFEAAAVYGNHAGPTFHYWIEYSLDGRNWLPLAEERTNQAGAVNVAGNVGRLPPPTLEAMVDEMEANLDRIESPILPVEPPAVTLLPDNTRRVWVRFAGIGNNLVTLKAVDVKLIFHP